MKCNKECIEKIMHFARENQVPVLPTSNLQEVDDFIDDVKEMVKADEYSVICDDSMYKIFSEITDDITSYTTLNANLAEILIRIVLERQNELTADWRMLTPLYIQPPPVFGK